jgi:hypothetical protein
MLGTYSYCDYWFRINVALLTVTAPPGQWCEPEGGHLDAKDTQQRSLVGVQRLTSTAHLAAAAAVHGVMATGKSQKLVYPLAAHQQHGTLVAADCCIRAWYRALTAAQSILHLTVSTQPKRRQLIVFPHFKPHSPRDQPAAPRRPCSALWAGTAPTNQPTTKISKVQVITPFRTALTT